VCGLHVHVSPADPEQRVDIMVRLMPYLPLLLALSTSSPFWQTHRTGLMGYRLAAYSELPRTGLPENFADAEDYQDYIDLMVETGAIADSSFVWWAIRPSRQHPTLELRIADSCTRLEDTMAIAALFRCLVRHLELAPILNAEPSGASRAITSENIWRAQRYGLHGGLICERRRAMVSVGDMLEEVLDMLAGDATMLGCEAELAHCHTILAEGTSADVQLALYEDAANRLGDRGQALHAVVDWLARETANVTRVHAMEAGHA
jgi:glutamate---cysteine ligase / carboxylate-amine ligase